LETGVLYPDDGIKIIPGYGVRNLAEFAKELWRMWNFNAA